MLICLGTSFFTLFPMPCGSDQVFRVGASIISGVGFLCSGVIFRDSGTVRGMNTAATLWCMAAIAAVILIALNLALRPLAQKLPSLVAGEDSEKHYRISIACHEDVEQEIRLQLLNGNTCKTLFLTNLESGDVVGEKVEIVAEYRFAGKPKNSVLEGIVARVLLILEVTGAGWEVL